MTTTISDALQRTTSERRRSSTSSSWPSLSVRQQTETEKFMKAFPSIEKVYSFFCPGRWEYAIRHTNECLAFPCITLSQVDSLYDTLGAATNIVKGHIVGIFGLSTAREQINEQAANLAAEMFVAKYGGYCTLYDTMLYFANYLLEFKQSFSAFDIQDILQQFSKKYLPWRRQRVRPEEDQQQQTKGITLAEMVYKWVADGRTDDDFREGGLYQSGIITDAMIQATRAEYQKAADGAAF